MIQIAESISPYVLGIADMKSFQEFLSEGVTIQGDFNGNMYIGSEQTQQQETYSADIVWEGKLYRLEMEGEMIPKNKLAEQIQGEYPGAIVHQVYPSENSSSKIKSAKRYQPERLQWSD